MKKITVYLIFAFAFVNPKKYSPVIENKKVTVTNVNVIEIIMDDFGYEIPTYTGGQSYSTPNLDALATGASVNFDQCNGSPTCTPSRMMLYSGKYNFRNYYTNRVMDNSVLTVANLCKLGGYGTALYGKWQLDGGDKIRQIFGFDRYSVLFPIGIDEDDKIRYKNPTLYRPVPGSSTNAEYYYPGVSAYSDDVFTDSAIQFMTDMSTAGTPFYCQVSFSGPHTPWSPTPDDPDYAAWDPLTNHGDSKYFPGMVNYVDKKIGQILTAINTLGIQNNTVVIIVGDNGTSSGITSQWNGITIQGGKKTTINYATHVPMLVQWSGHVSHTVNNNLISFTDMLPTISDITGIPIPGGWGTIDGQSFYPLLAGTTFTPRNSWYIYWGSTDQGNKTEVWAMKFDGSSNLKKLYSGGSLYNTTIDPYEYCPVIDALTEGQLQSIISGLHE